MIVIMLIFIKRAANINDNPNSTPTHPQKAKKAKLKTNMTKAIIARNITDACWCYPICPYRPPRNRHKYKYWSFSIKAIVSDVG